MKLALRLGCTLAELTQRMSVSEFRSWMAFSQLSPIGDERHDVLHAISAYASVMPHVKRGGKSSVGDFIPKWSEETKKNQTAAKVSQFFMGMVAKTGGKRDSN